MKIGLRIGLLAAAGTLTFVACRDTRVTSPTFAPAATAASNRAPAKTAHGNSSLVHCTKREPVADSAVIGPNGGTLRIGTTELVIPPGALDRWVHIGGEVPSDSIASVRFWPEGLRFKKPAGLVLDATGCDMPAGDPSLLYIDDHGTILEEIEARFDQSWRRVAAPISHFSRYALAV